MHSMFFAYLDFLKHYASGLLEVESYQLEKTSFAQLRNHTKHLLSRVYCNRYCIFYKDRDTGKTKAYCRCCVTVLFGRVVEMTLFGLLDEGPLIRAMQCLACFNIDSYGFSQLYRHVIRIHSQGRNSLNKLSTI